MLVKELIALLNVLAATSKLGGVTAAGAAALATALVFATLLAAEGDVRLKGVRVFLGAMGAAVFLGAGLGAGFNARLRTGRWNDGWKDVVILVVIAASYMDGLTLMLLQEALNVPTTLTHPLTHPLL